MVIRTNAVMSRRYRIRNDLHSASEALMQHRIQKKQGGNLVSNNLEISLTVGFHPLEDPVQGSPHGNH